MCFGANTSAGAESEDDGGERARRWSLFEALRPEQRWHLGVLLGGGFMVDLGVGLIVPVLPIFANELGLGASGVGLILSAPFASKVVLNIPLGAVTDTHGRVATATAGETMAALGMLGTGLATNITTLLPCRLLVGAGAAASEAGTVAYLADLTEQPRLRPHRGVIIGLKSSCGAAAWCAGPAIGGFLGSAFGAPAAFATVGAIQGAAAMLYRTLPESIPSSPASSRDGAEASAETETQTETETETETQTQTQTQTGARTDAWAGGEATVSLERVTAQGQEGAVMVSRAEADIAAFAATPRNFGPTGQEGRDGSSMAAGAGKGEDDASAVPPPAPPRPLRGLATDAAATRWGTVGLDPGTTWRKYETWRQYEPQSSTYKLRPRPTRQGADEEEEEREDEKGEGERVVVEGSRAVLKTARDEETTHHGVGQIAASRSYECSAVDGAESQLKSQAMSQPAEELVKARTVPTVVPATGESGLWTSLVNLANTPVTQVVLASSLALHANYAAMTLVLPLRATEIWPATPAELGILFSAIAAMGLIGGPFAGMVTDRYGRKAGLVPGLLLCTVGAAGVGLSSSVYPFVCALSVWGAGESLLGPSIASLAADTAPSESKGAYLAVVRQAGDMALLCCPLALGCVADLASTSAAMGVVSVATAAVVFPVVIQLDR